MNNSPDKYVDNSPDKYVDKLIEISDKKIACLRDMLKLTKAQSRVITEDGVETLQKLVSDKQARIDEINRLDQDFDICLQLLKSCLNIKSLEELGSPYIKGVSELQSLINDIMGLVNEILETEKHNSSMAKNLLDDIEDKMKKLRNGKKASQAYRKGPVQTQSYFIDKKK